MSYRLTNQVSIDVRGCAVDDCAHRRRERHGTEPRERRLGRVRKVEDESLRKPEPALRPRGGHRHVALAGNRIREVVQHECGLVTEGARLLRPEPERNEVLVVAGRVVDEPKDATGIMRYAGRPSSRENGHGYPATGGLAGWTGTMG